MISANNEFIISFGYDGTIFLWETPLEIRLGKIEDEN